MKTIASIEQFEFFMGAYFSTKHLIEIQNGKIYISNPLYAGLPTEKRIEINPSADKMNAFIDRLNAIGILQWKRLYDSENMDGMEWDLDIKYNGGKSFHSYGHMNYPGINAGDGNVSVIFKAFLFAISELIEIDGYFDE